VYWYGDMAFKPMVQVESADDLIEQLPWGNKWVRNNDDYAVPRDVYLCHQYDSGIMVVCLEYKAYIHEGSTLFAHLSEALSVWAKSKEATNVLQVVLNKKGKPMVGLDEERTNHRWNYSEGRFTQVSKKSEVGKEKGISSNPLLAGGGVRTTVEKTGSSTKSQKTTA
jgi:hypothetical protein